MLTKCDELFKNCFTLKSFIMVVQKYTDYAWNMLDRFRLIKVKKEKKQKGQDKDLLVIVSAGLQLH